MSSSSRLARLVHRHETNRAIVLRGVHDAWRLVSSVAIQRLPFPNPDDEVESVWLN